MGLLRKLGLVTRKEMEALEAMEKDTSKRFKELHKDYLDLLENRDGLLVRVASLDVAVKTLEQRIAAMNIQQQRR